MQLNIPKTWVFPTALPDDSESLRELLKTLSDQYVELYNEFARIAEHHTDDGGFAIWLTNKTGAASVKGKLVKADIAVNSAVVLTAAADDECFGVFLEDGVADGAEALIVVAGKAYVRFDDNVGAVRGNWVGTGAAGYARTQAAPPALGVAAHFEEVAHSLETVAAGGAGTFILGLCNLGFN